MLKKKADNESKVNHTMKTDASHIKQAKTVNKERSMPPLPKVPEPHPEKPPPNIPIPGDNVLEGVGSFVCKKCGKTFNSKNELKLHMQTDHPKLRK
jgi:hypothetical protein